MEWRRPASRQHLRRDLFTHSLSVNFHSPSLLQCHVNDPADYLGRVFTRSAFCAQPDSAERSDLLTPTLSLTTTLAQVLSDQKVTTFELWLNSAIYHLKFDATSSDNFSIRFNQSCAIGQMSVEAQAKFLHSPSQTINTSLFPSCSLRSNGTLRAVRCYFERPVVELSRLSHITDSKLLQSFQHTCLPCVRSVRLRLRDVRRVADVNDLIDRMISLRALELDLGRLEQALNELGPGHVERNAPIPTRTGISELQRRHFASGKDWNGRHPNKSKLAGAVDKWKKRDRKFTLATVFRFICWCTHWEDRHLTTVPREWVSEKKPKLISLSWLICLDGED